ncbi:MAG: gp53-like domain-containing protein [Candidatus Binataceae bacterium]
MMATLIDSPEFTANEIYEIQQTDPVEGAGAGASFSGIGVSNEPHQQLANRTALLYGRQNTNIANISALQSFVAGFIGSLKTAGYLKIPLTDVSRGPAIAIIQWGYYALAQQSIPNDTQFTVSWPIPFPNAILLPPLATNVYYHTVGGNTVASVISYGVSGATFVLDVPGTLLQRAGLGNEQSNGFSWLAIGF